MANLALDMRAAFERLCEQKQLALGLRIGIDSGPAIAGVIGRHKFSYDLWGHTINTASRMEAHGVRGEIQVSEATYELLCNDFVLERRGEIAIKGQGRRPAYLLKRRR
jgi:class 3 adenylate cyclase